MIPVLRFRKIFNKFISWKGLVFLCVIAISLLTVNIGLSWWSQTVLFKTSNVYYPKPIANKISNENADTLKQLALWSVLDSSGEFKYFIAALKGKSYQYQKFSLGYHENLNRTQTQVDENDITLVTQCSLNRVHLLPELAKKWQGPVSVAVLLLSEEVQSGVQTLILLQKCFPDVANNVTFSLVFPLNSLKSSPISSTQETECSQLFASTRLPKRQNYNFSGIVYPNNLLRNVARRAAQSNYILVLDVDMLPSKDLRNRFLKFIAEREVTVKQESDGSKLVWVLPSYEIDESVEVPEDKESLLRLREALLARPFYQELCWKCQKYTEYESWEQAPTKDASNKLNVLAEVLWKDPWEPFYISRADIPLYDERFRQYGFNRISQVCELHVAGYRFLILDSAFLIHKGFKRADAFHSTKDAELEKNRILYRQFKDNLKERYPESSRRCY